MTYRIRTWHGDTPLPALDVTTDSRTLAFKECRTIATEHGWDDVSLNVLGERPLRGDELRRLVEQSS